MSQKKISLRAGAAYVRALRAVEENGPHASTMAIADVCKEMAEMLVSEPNFPNAADTAAAAQWIRFADDLTRALDRFEESQRKLYREMEE